jgi:hypothetical protein
MTEPSGRGQPADGQRSSQQSGGQRSSSQQGRGRSGGAERGAAGPGASWEKRAAGLASEVQRWLIRTSARNMRDELGDQVKKAFRGSGDDAADTWATATTEPPHAADEAPECAWCPLCRAARLIAQARAGGDSRRGPKLSDAADMMAGAMRDAFASLDSILSYRPGEPPQPRPSPEPPLPATPQSAPSRAEQEPPRAAPPQPRPAAGGSTVDVPADEPAQQSAVEPTDDPSEST